MCWCVRFRRDIYIFICTCMCTNVYYLDICIVFVSRLLYSMSQDTAIRSVLRSLCLAGPCAAVAVAVASIAAALDGPFREATIRVTPRRLPSNPIACSCRSGRPSAKHKYTQYFVKTQFSSVPQCRHSKHLPLRVCVAAVQPRVPPCDVAPPDRRYSSACPAIRCPGATLECPRRCALRSASVC